MTNYTTVQECPEWSLTNVYHTGNWTNPFAEAFSEVEGQAPTHLHIYDYNAMKAQYLDHGWRHPSTITTLSYAQ
jgi:hypothetical protein